MTFHLPPRIRNQNGEKRRVGFELEFGGLSIPEAADILQSLFGGHLVKTEKFAAALETRLGRFEIEADSTFLKQRKYGKYLALAGLESLSETADDVLGQLAGTLIPFEIITPPLPIDALEPVENIRAELLRHSARGTKSSLFMAFGMQFNPEVPGKDVETALKHLRAFFLLYDWLFEESEIPVARKVAPFIQNFPEVYRRSVLNPSYTPNLKQFMRDYMELNPTRNRPLDMLPLFKEIDADMVKLFPVEHDLIKPRPTFHYRLPNSMVDDPTWQIKNDWNKWVEVERLAADESLLLRMTEDYFSLKDENFLFIRTKWAAKTREWLRE
jgi:hypothetical protein